MQLLDPKLLPIFFFVLRYPGTVGEFMDARECVCPVLIVRTFMHAHEYEQAELSFSRSDVTRLTSDQNQSRFAFSPYELAERPHPSREENGKPV